MVKKKKPSKVMVESFSSLGIRGVSFETAKGIAARRDKERRFTEAQKKFRMNEFRKTRTGRAIVDVSNFQLDKGKRKSRIPSSFGKSKVNISKVQRGIFG